jgi:uncharacterized membrane protein HdeD (DUF308 family)
MKTEKRMPFVVLGLLCLMPALFFWVVNGMRVEMPFSPAGLLFGGAPQLELYCCAILFPLLGVIMGWLALRNDHRHVMGWVIILIGLVQAAAGVFVAVS